MLKRTTLYNSVKNMPKFNLYALIGKLGRIEKKIDILANHLGLEIKEKETTEKDKPAELIGLPASLKEAMAIKNNPKGVKKGLEGIKKVLDGIKK